MYIILIVYAKYALTIIHITYYILYFIFSQYKENRQLKSDYCHFKNELTEYQLKCKQLEKEIKEIEIERNAVLEAYAKSWGHHNEKQKIKYTGKLIKDIDSITQVINAKKIPHIYVNNHLTYLLL